MSVVALKSRWKSRSRSSVAVVALLSVAASVGTIVGVSPSPAFGQSSYSGGAPAAPSASFSSNGGPGSNASSTGPAPNGAAPPARPTGASSAPAASTGVPNGAASAPPANSTNGAASAPAANSPSNLAASEVAPFFQAPSTSGTETPEIDGSPLTLEKVLYGVSSPVERRRRLLAYWDLAGKLAAFNLSVQNSSFVDQCVGKTIQKYGGQASLPPETLALALASQTKAKTRREVARLDFLRAQYDFDAAFVSRAARRAALAISTAKAFDSSSQGASSAASSTRPTALLYVPSTPPTTLEYAARFEESSRTRRLSNEAARLNVALPLLFETLTRRAESSKQEFGALTAAFAGSPSDGELFAAVDRCFDARNELLDAAIRYNKAIAAYAVEVVPGDVVGSALLATLNQRPSGKSTPERPAAVASGTPKTFADASPAVETTATDLTPTPGANFEPVSATVETSTRETQADSASESSESATAANDSSKSEPASTNDQPKTENAPAEPPKTENAPAEPSKPENAPDEPPKPENAPSEPPKPENAPDEQPKPEEPPEESRSARTVPASLDGWVVRGQAPQPADDAAIVDRSFDGSAPAPPARNATAAPQTPTRETPPTSVEDSSARVLAIGSAIFATPTPETSENAVASETPFSLRDALNRVSTNPFERFAVVRTYWELKGFVARIEIEKAAFASYAKAVDDFKAKLAAGTQPDAAFVADSNAFLAAARRAQARVAEATLQKREAQLELAQATNRAPEAGRPLPSTTPFFGPSYRLSTPPRFDSIATIEAATIPEKLAAIQKIGALLGSAANLLSPEVSPVTDADPFVALQTIETKRETALLFVELVVSANVSIADYVARFPTERVSADRFAEALVGPAK